jgi:hypothetical protein
MLLVSRRPERKFAARFLCRAGFFDFQGALIGPQAADLQPLYGAIKGLL